MEFFFIRFNNSMNILCVHSNGRKILENIIYARICSQDSLFGDATTIVHDIFRIFGVEVFFIVDSIVLMEILWLFLLKKTHFQII